MNLAAVIATSSVTVIVAILSCITAIRVARIETGVAQVNRAVNHVPEGSPTLVQRVTKEAETNAKRWDWTCESVTAIGREVGAVLQSPPQAA